MSKRKTRVALIQMACAADAEANLAKALRKVAQAARAGAKIVCLPELFLGPYFCQAKTDRKAFSTAEVIPGATTKILGQTARKHGIVLIGGSLFERKGGRYFNTAPVLGPDGKLIGVHRKVHIPEDPLFHEQRYFEASKAGFRVHNTPFGKIAVLICFDQWFPEAARIAALQGAQIIFYPTAIGVIDDDVEENITGDWEAMWRNAQLGHAATNNVYVAAVNRVGREGSLRFWGGSFIADPSSKILNLARSNETIVYADCDFDKVKALQEAWGFFRNRHPEAYKPLTKRIR